MKTTRAIPRGASADTTARPGTGAVPALLMSPGEIIDHRYRVIEQLGEGGMGAVFKVEHTRMGKIMALKLLRRDLARDRALVQAFEQEAQIVSKLSSTHTVGVFDFGEIPERGLYMAMEFVPGRDLAALLAADGAFSEPAVIGIALQVLASLAEAHDAGVVHRDIKPANVMMLRTREAKDFVKVLDFGIARLGAGNAAPGDDTFQGTAEYAAPEQIRAAAIDGRADLYSLAVTMFELLTGRPPFVADTPVQVCVDQLSKPAPRPRDIIPTLQLSSALENAIMRALAKDPLARFASADEMRTALGAIGEGHKLTLPRVTALREVVAVDKSIAQRDDWDAFERSLRRSARLRRGLVAATSIAALVAVIGVGGMMIHRAHQVAQQVAIAEEREPNNGPGQANMISAGRPLRGTIGARLNDTDSDLDAFQLEVPTPSRLRVRVTAVPNVNLALELLQRRQDGGRVSYRTLARVDDQPLNSPLAEQLDDVRVDPGTYVLQLRDRRRAAEHDVTRPRENSTDRYELTVALDPDDPLSEQEPDDTADDLQRVALRSVDQPVLGHTGQFAPRDLSGKVAAARWSDDQYAFRLDVGATRACALLVGVPNTTLELALSTGGAAPVRATTHDRGVGVACTPAHDRVRVSIELSAGGNLDERYLLVLTDDSAGGRTGLRRAAQLLDQQGRQAEGKALLARAESGR
jgi:serine/threonine-protein kinase